MAAAMEADQITKSIRYTVNMLNFNKLANFGSMIPITLFKVSTVRLNAPDTKKVTIIKYVKITKTS